MRQAIPVLCATVLAAAAGGAVPPGTAAALAVQGEITVATVGRSTVPAAPIDVTAQATVTPLCDPTTPCAWTPVVTTVPADQPCSSAVTAASWTGSPLDQGSGQAPQTLTPRWQEQPERYAGPKRACLYARAAGGDTLVAEAAYEVPRPGSTRLGPALPRAPIPRSVGVRRAVPYRLSTALVPPGVSRKRFALLARVAAKRWGLRYAGALAGPPRSGDGVDSVGFSRDVPSIALGVTRLRGTRYYRKVGGVRKVVATRITERDTSFALAVPWDPGPGLPTARTVDLQTVILHELGHFAGNGHVRSCLDSPMWSSLGTGEWWHGPGDWFKFGCAQTPATAVPPTVEAAGALLVQRSYRDVTIAG
jgi:hypothetical protein